MWTAPSGSTTTFGAALGCCAVATEAAARQATARAEARAWPEWILRLDDLRGCMARSPVSASGRVRGRARSAPTPAGGKLSAKLQSIAIGPPATMIPIDNQVFGGKPCQFA